MLEILHGLLSTLLSDLIGYRTMESDIVISELLCFVNCKYGTVSIQSLMSTVIGFYDVEDIYEAKKKLNDIAQKCIENPPTHGKWQGDGRKKRECEDLLSMYEALDKAECKLPKFVAEDLNKCLVLKLAILICVFWFRKCPI